MKKQQGKSKCRHEWTDSDENCPCCGATWKLCLKGCDSIKVGKKIIEDYHGYNKLGRTPKIK
jgi:hypothetical protein